MVPLNGLPHHKEALIRFLLTGAVLSMSLFNLLLTHGQHMPWNGQYISYICNLEEVRGRRRLIKQRSSVSNKVSTNIVEVGTNEPKGQFGK